MTAALDLRPQLEPANDPLADPVHLGALMERSLEKHLANLPRPPMVAMEILELSRDSTASLDVIARTLQRDALLAGRVFKLANASMYLGSAPCTSLKQALARLGLEQTQDVVMEAAFHLTVLRAPAFEVVLEQLRKHSTAVAWLSRMVARLTPVEAEHSFLTGLFHDVGLSVGLVFLYEHLRQQRVAPRMTEGRWKALLAVHAELGAQVLSQWRVGEGVVAIARAHHALDHGSQPHPAVAVSLLAEHLASGLGWGVGGVASGWTEPALTPAELALALETVSLEPLHLQRLRPDAERLLAQLQSQFTQPRFLD
jgi:HD-like signal output (HDOD) protein